MYRIDDYTYIDDTLITCAEYQLFLDEMRASGVYYQPDHWQSYQFPTGQADMPILGVRSADAIDFCLWLRRQTKAGDWLYRLPTPEEAYLYPLLAAPEIPCGYWVFNNSAEPQLSWVHKLTDTSLLIRSLTRAFALDSARAGAFIFDLRIDPDNANELARTLTRARDRDLRRAVDRACASVLDLDRARDIARARALKLDRDFLLAFNRTRNLNFDRGLDHILSRALTRASEIARELDFARTFDFVRGRGLELDYLRHLIHNLTHLRHLTRDFDTAIDIYLDLYLLIERIAGRYPAFEGIRIVKERKRDE